MLPVLAMLWTLTLGAIPPLSDAQQAQLATADDGSPVLDEGALYALLANVATWPREPEPQPQDIPKAMSGAIVPDYDTLLADPQAHRGELFQVEGVVAARADAFKLVRAGAWGAELARWVIATDPARQEAVLVYLVGVSPRERPPLGSTVRIPARFYRLLHTNAATGEPVTYLTFIGARPRVIRSASLGRNGLGTGGPSIPTMLMLLVVMAGALVLLLRRTLRLSLEPRPTAAQLRRLADRQRRPTMPPSDAQDAQPLPDDPAAAMAQLRRRHGQS